MGTTRMKSFRLARTTCPQCDSQRTRIDWTAIGNLLRVPGAVASELLIYPVIGIRMSCKQCGCRFLASRNGQEAART
jgi:hypothetical protein